MKNYTVTLSKQIIVDDIEANSAKEAQDMAKNSFEGGNGFFVQEIYDTTTDQEVMLCEFCGADILESDERTYDDDGNRYCHNCFDKNKSIDANL